MQVRMLTGRVGRGFTQRYGDVVTVPDAEGKRLIDSGQAEPVAGRRSVETATKSRGEQRAAAGS